MDTSPIKNIRTAVVTTSTGKDVKDTKQLSGEASDSLSGKNSTTQYGNSGGVDKGNLGGLPSHK
jgi:hypothetical protein